jgi:hypothetical protein
MTVSHLPRMFRLVMAGAAFATVLIACGTLGIARAESGSLAGSWRGSGSIAFSSGTKERAHCRAYFAKTGATSYRMSATCATASAKVDQSAKLTKVGARTYVGSFYNEQYNTGGRIHITVSGRRQSVHLSGEAGSADFLLRKR